ncbi:hypothetical protein GLOTRDRAFT_109267 [Gloeophyllum trabeum ATCC 11539]|uniref:Uncharacterized protein n=1 Tax=Gloeophyllum trabeum (strain ATCC 11539 / FP-39264 / Madison 617) TaxID=670483 RepID=S7S0Y2_GLOTA|nr:uncharacterized protein GLOTRDRAFT_109267 [Gloeophyllum trabeum ATCC 11539]EPQ61025.1 hypothetical protein GLOTRDRAFT_109267 [Gloeophyllum trabeum ATCC 11539]
MFRNAISQTSRATLAGSRQLHSSPVAYKSVTEKVKEVGDKVNKSLGKGLAGAIEKGEKATEATKETLGTTAEQAKQKTSEASTVAGQKANETAAKAREGKDDTNEAFKH